MRWLSHALLLMGLVVLLSAEGSVAAERPSIEGPTEPACKLVLEDAKRPGTKVDVADFRGRPVVLRGMCPE